MYSRYRRRREKQRQFLQSAKARPCADCGIQYPFYVMQFDHARGEKAFRLQQSFNHGRETMMAEIEKCDVVCANCHASRTYQRQQEKGFGFQQLWLPNLGLT